MMSSSSLLEILINIAKTKLIALLAGTAGIGLLGLYQSLINLIRSLAGIFAGAGLVQAVAGTDPHQHRALYRQILRYVLFAALGVTTLVILASPQLADYFFGNPKRWQEIAGIGLIVPLVFCGVFWRSWLNGLGRIKNLAWLKVQSTILVALISILLVWRYGMTGIYLSALLTPLPVALLAGWLVWRINHSTSTSPSHDKRPPANTLRHILTTGNTLFISSLLFTLAVIAVKAEINRHLDTHHLGLFQASWSLSMVYVEIFLAALGVDLFPRLAKAKENDTATQSILNQQLTFSLILAIPVILLLMLMAPWLLHWLYSSEFTSAATTLRWQLMGDFFKLISWILGYWLIASGRLLWSLLIQATWVSIFLGTAHWGMPVWGLEASGIGFTLAYLATTLVSLALLWSAGIRLNRFNHWLLALIATMASLLAWLFHYHSKYAQPVLASLVLIFASVSLAWLWRSWHNSDNEQQGKPI